MKGWGHGRGMGGLGTVVTGWFCACRQSIAADDDAVRASGDDLKTAGCAGKLGKTLAAA